MSEKKDKPSPSSNVNYLLTQYIVIKMNWLDSFCILTHANDLEKIFELLKSSETSFHNFL